MTLNKNSEGVCDACALGDGGESPLQHASRFHPMLTAAMRRREQTDNRSQIISDQFSLSLPIRGRDGRVHALSRVGALKSPKIQRSNLLFSGDFHPSAA